MDLRYHQRVIRKAKVVVESLIEVTTSSNAYEKQTSIPSSLWIAPASTCMAVPVNRTLKIDLGVHLARQNEWQKRYP
jgi:hypothetical protein